jgi:F-type H+-transporting ATPase subunit delta
MIVASRYAKSLLDLSVEKGQLEAVYTDVLLVKSICDNSHDFINFLNSPIIKADKKVSTLKAIFDGKVNIITSGFLTIVANKRREAVIPQMVVSFIEQYKSNKHILTAVITSARGLDSTTKQQALALVKAQLNGEIELVEKIDANVIGGFILKIGDKQLDKSVARQLSNLKKQLTTN